MEGPRRRRYPSSLVDFHRHKHKHKHKHKKDKAKGDDKKDKPKEEPKAEPAPTTDVDPLAAMSGGLLDSLGAQLIQKNEDQKDPDEEKRKEEERIKNKNLAKFATANITNKLSKNLATKFKLTHKNVDEDGKRVDLLVVDQVTSTSCRLRWTRPKTTYKLHGARIMMREKEVKPGVEGIIPKILDQLLARADGAVAAPGVVSGRRGTFATHASWTSLPEAFRQAGWLTLSAGKVFHTEEGGTGPTAELDGPGMPPNNDPRAWSSGDRVRGGMGWCARSSAPRPSVCRQLERR